MNVGQLISTLERLDPNLPVGAILVDQTPGSSFVEVRTGDVVDVDVVHDPVDGSPQAIWITVHRLPEDASVRRPSTVWIESPRCSCWLAVPVHSRTRRNLDAVACDHHVPSEVTLACEARRSFVP
jgi:hypothetical protein